LFNVGGTIVGFIACLTIQMGFYYLYYWPRKMEIDSKRVFFLCFLPYVIIGAVAYFSVSFISIGESCVITGGVKEIIFAVIFIILSFIVMPKKDKTYL